MIGAPLNVDNGKKGGTPVICTLENKITLKKRSRPTVPVKTTRTLSSVTILFNILETCSKQVYPVITILEQ